VALPDDPGPARARADLVIDPPTGHDWPPAAGRRLGGFEHALVRREVRAAADAPLPDVGVLLTLGGSDPQGLTPAITQALSAAGIPSTTVLGPGYRGAPIAGALRDPADFAHAIAGAELVVTAFGHTLIEAAHLGVPCVALAVRDGDAADAEAFCAHGFATWIDLSGGPAPERVAAEVARLHADPAARATMGERGRALVDGRGAARVAAALRELA
jgi:spore coat polysaccharide biosynthesis predicted glycosyltransferase SpsG